MRGLAGLVGDCLVVNLPGSRGGVKDALAVLDTARRAGLDPVVVVVPVPVSVRNGAVRREPTMARSLRGYSSTGSRACLIAVSRIIRLKLPPARNREIVAVRNGVALAQKKAVAVADVAAPPAGLWPSPGPSG